MKKLSTLIVVLLCLGLSGCGWHPLYGDGGANKPTTVAALNRIALAAIPDRDGQMLRNLLIDRMYGAGRPTQPAYRLEIALQQYRAGLGIRKDATAARSQLNVTARCRLVNTRNEQQVLTFDTNTIVSYNVVDAQYAALVAEQNAHERALQDIAEKIVNRLALHFNAP